MKIKNGPIEPKMVSIVCASFLLAGYVIFFDCATPAPLLLKGVKTPCIFSENSKWSDWCEDGVNCLCFVCAGRLCDFFRLCYHCAHPNGGKNPSYIYGRNSSQFKISSEIFSKFLQNQVSSKMSKIFMKYLRFL